MTNEPSVTHITTGFLAGNLISESGYDVDASAREYRDLLYAALEEAYPGVEIEVLVQFGASGVIPGPLQTCVSYSDDHDYGESYDPHGDVGVVDGIGERVFEDGNWYVEETEETV